MGTAGHHDGEQAVQLRAGEGGPGWGSPMFSPEIPHGFDAFLAEQRLVALGAPADGGALWCTVLTGPAGFITADDDRTIVIDALPAHGDPLRDVFEEPRHLGMVVVSPQTRRRIRANGTAQRDGGRLVTHTEQVLGNCPKYLQHRTVVEDHSAPAATGRIRTGSELDVAQQRWVGQADTFFIASLAPGHGADASHRGGRAGFVTVAGPRRLVWPDYVGNSFYMTLGNMELEPRCGLVFLDWENGHTLQLTGRGRIDWNADRARTFPGALRTVEFDIDRLVQVDRASSLRWELHGYSRFNPPAPASGGGTDTIGD